MGKEKKFGAKGNKENSCKTLSYSILQRYYSKKLNVATWIVTGFSLQVTLARYRLDVVYSGSAAIISQFNFTESH